MCHGHKRFSRAQQDSHQIGLFSLNWNKHCPLGKKKSNNCEDIIANADLTFWPTNCLHHSETDMGRKCSSLNCLHNDFSGRVFRFCSRPVCALCAIILCSQNIQPFESLNQLNTLTLLFINTMLAYALEQLIEHSIITSRARSNKNISE